MNMTLREVCRATNVTRRAVQGYEKYGMVAASGRTDRGHLLYDEGAKERIEQIKLYQEWGFSLKEIRGIIDAPNNELKIVLQKQLSKLMADRNYQDELIEKLHEQIERL